MPLFTKHFLGFSHRPSALRKRQFAFLFVCAKGELEIKSALLAASLKRSLKCRHQLVACLPDAERLGRASLETLSFLKSLGVRLEEVANPLGPECPHAVKIACLQVEVAADKVVFLDSDMLCMEPFDEEARFYMPLNVKPADLQAFTTDRAVWKRVYDDVYLGMPERDTATTVSEESGPPYFNSGFIAANSGKDLAVAWLYCARKLNADSALPRRDKWSDQTSLAAAIHLMGQPCDLLEEKYNYPAHLRPLKDAPAPHFLHYHWPSVLRREPRANQLVQELASEHPPLAAILRRDPEWAQLLEPYAVRPRHGVRHGFEGVELVITGISRSGTSHLAALLHGYSNCVVINEPAEVVEYLRDEAVPTRVATFYRDLRRKVLDRVPMLNKVEDGEVVEDTRLRDARDYYVPGVDAADFVIGVKNTRAFLSRLDVLVEKVLPAARFVACVRNPFDTIASWKGSFPHLRDADVEGVPVGHAHDRHLRGEDRAKLQRIAAMADPAERRAWWWRFFAEILLRHRDRVRIVHYESFVRDPLPVLEKILAGAHAGHPRKPIAGSAPRSRRELLDARDMEIIREVCAEPAKALGVSME